MRILQVCAEIFPLLKTGGLADVAGALPPALGALGADVRVLLPGFDAILAGLSRPSKSPACKRRASWGATPRACCGGACPRSGWTPT